MALWDRVSNMLALRPYQEDVQARNIADMDMGSETISDMLLRSQGLRTVAWRAASIRDALGVPAIFGAVNLIANVGSSMNMEAFRNGIRLAPDERPRIIIRPDPFTIPREFYRSTFYNLATRGEAWWWIAARDFDGLAMSVISVAPHEVTVEENRDDLRYPIIKWRDKVMKNEDFRQLVYAREPGNFRGHGPLQMCGAAISVAVESQTWAANMYAGGAVPPVVLKSATELGEDPETGVSEADTMRDAWMNAERNNTPRVIDPGIEELIFPDGNSASGQMLEARAFQNSEVATMFNMDAEMLNAAVSGQSITYQNVGQKFDQFVRMCLDPNYLNVTEQSMTDLLARSTVAKFDKDAITMADVKTRWEVYNLAIPVVGAETADEMAREFEGLSPGDVENAALPFSPPQAIPASIPKFRTEEVEVRCDGKRMMRGVLRPCNRLLTKTGEFVGRCPRCGKDQNIAVQVRVQVPSPAPVIPIASRRKPDPIPEPAPVPQGPSLEEITALIDQRVATLQPSPVINFHDGAFRNDVHMPPTPRVSKRIERDGTGYIVTEE